MSSFIGGCLGCQTEEASADCKLTRTEQFEPELVALDWKLLLWHGTGDIAAQIKLSDKHNKTV